MNGFRLTYKNAVTNYEESTYFNIYREKIQVNKNCAVDKITEIGFSVGTDLTSLRYTDKRSVTFQLPFYCHK